MYRQFQIQQFFVLPRLHSFFCVDLRKKTAIISIYKINLFVFTTQRESVYCAVQTGYLNQMDRFSSSKG